MKGYTLVVLGLLAFFGRTEARPEDGSPTVTEKVKKADEVEENKDDHLKTGEDPSATSTESAAKGNISEKSGEADSADPKVKRATDEAPPPIKEENGESSTEGSTTAAPVDGGKSGEPEAHDKNVESTETPKINGKETIEEKPAPKVDENKSDDHVNERSGEAESRENKDSAKEDLESVAEVSTSTEVVHQKSAYSSSSILETKGRSGDSGDSDSSDFKGRAHMNLRVQPVNPLAAINNLNDIGSRRMAQPHLMYNVSPNPPIRPILPQAPPSTFNSYMNAAPRLPTLPSLPNLAPAPAPGRSYTEQRPETNAYPYSPTSSQQADSLPKFPTLRELPKLPSYPGAGAGNFYKPYDQNYSGNFGVRPRRYTVSSAPDTVNRYAYNNFGYPHYIK